MHERYSVATDTYVGAQDGECSAPPTRRTGELRSEGAYEHLRTHGDLLTKLAEQARDGGELRRALFEDAANVIAILSKDGTILEQNASWARVMGLPRERMIGRHIGDFAADGHEHTNLDGYRDTFGDASTTVAALKAGDGRTLYMQFSNTVVQLGGESVVFSLGHDITERVFATRSAKMAEAKYRLLIEHIPDVVCTVGENQTLTFVTPNVARVTGYSQAEMYEGGIPLWRSYVSLLLPQVRCALVAATLLLAMAAARVYDLVVAMTNGGPGNATELPAKFVMAYLFVRQNVGLASAAATLMLLTVAVLLALGWTARRTSSR